MKAFFKTYWLELALFAVALVGEVGMASCSRSVEPSRPSSAQVVAPAFAVVQLPGACLVRFGLHAYFERYPVQALLFGCLDGFVPLLLSVALLVCQLSSVLGAFGLFFPVLYVLLAELVLLVLLCVCLAVKHGGEGAGRPQHIAKRGNTHESLFQNLLAGGSACRCGLCRSLDRHALLAGECSYPVSGDGVITRTGPK